MKAIVINQFGDLSVLAEADIPTPKPSRGQVQIQVVAVGFNPVDIKIRSGFFPKATFPLVLGVDCSGVITAVGNKFGRFEVGDEVVAFAFGEECTGTYAESICLPHQFVAKKPKNLSFEQAAATPLVSLTAFQALIPSGALQKERSIFIPAGGGGVGGMAISLARAYGAGPIFTTAGSEESASYIMKTHAIPRDHILFYHGKTCEQQASELIAMHGGQRFPCCFDTVGGEIKKLCVLAADFYGHVVTILPEEQDFDLPVWGRENNLFFHKSLSLHEIFVGAPAYSGQEADWVVYKEQLEHLMHLFEKKEIDIPPPTVLGPFSVDSVKKAHEILESGRTRGKLVMSGYLA